MTDLTKIKHGELNIENLVQGGPRFSYGVTSKKRTCTKKHARKLVKAHLEPRKVNSQTYYWYRRGIDPPVYLGSADVILQAVKKVNI